MRRLAFAAGFLAASLWAQAPDGIPRDLARQRAQQLQDVHYRLSYIIEPEAASFRGREELGFFLKTGDRGVERQWIDFRGDSIGSFVVNGQSAAANLQNGHIEVPGGLLKAGKNIVEIDFMTPVAPSGKAITRFEDKDDGSEYVYTLFVPMDAEMAFPCFDQPDIKAQFQLTIQAPADWTVISNTAPASVAPQGHTNKTVFAETQPISTYLFAFAAGPFKKVNNAAGLPGLYVRQSKVKRAEEEAAAVQQITADGMKYLADYFAQPFPFPKYDLVMIPGFAYGGMEHAGATFVREESVLFRTAPTHSDRLNRDILLLHELTHQWFGDLVTMRWFDDLWLKEGFANYMAYHALADLKPHDNVWKRFYQATKPPAYAIDSTQGTTPIYQDISNLKDAKSAYGAIVYSKAPAVLKQLAFVLGEADFRNALRQYLKEHAYGNAEWSDLVGAFESISGKPLQGWADAYIKRRGMPQVDVKWSCHDLTDSTSLTLSQHDVLGSREFWPIANQVVMHFPNSNRVKRMDWQGATAEFFGANASDYCPDWVFANDQDYAYGRFLLDSQSRKAVMERLGDISDLFQRTLLWGSLWDSVREAELDPREYIQLALHLLPAEKDEALARSILGHTVTALHRYVAPEVRAKLVRKAELEARDRMLHSSDADLRIIWFRGLRSVAESSEGLTPLKDLLSGKLKVPGVELRQLDRWNIVAALIALHDPQAESILAAEEKKDPTGEGRKYAYMAKAARPDASLKKQYFDDYLHNATLPEDWVDQSLDAFNYWNQSELTGPYLHPALDALPQIKRERKIFFLLAWLNAFLDGQQSAQAQAQVHEFLNSPGLDKDLRLKILEVSDELDRTVKIREKYK
ncbi:MAG TPA: M1 family aminopeptidase [Candidatus Angelobacter sp.]|nr:M1 family aminopeptidase [Candidatus Angelobacter sp.]